jgi:polysaccharide biosynthesis/export protein
MMTARALMAAAAAVLLTATLAAAAENGPPARGDGRAERPDYRIGPEDVLEVSVWKNEAMSQTVPVRPDGMISLPLLNDVPAAGMTPMELKELLAKRLSEYMPSPEVSVIVREVRSFKVSVIGEVAHPGRYELKSVIWSMTIATVSNDCARSGLDSLKTRMEREARAKMRRAKRERLPANMVSSR